MTSLICGAGSEISCYRTYQPEHAVNFMMHLLTHDVEAWWQHVEASKFAQKYGVLVEPIDNRPWGMRDFAIADPTGVLWRIGQNAAAVDLG